MTETPSNAPDATPVPNLADTMADYEKKYAENLARREEILPLNKAVLFDALAAAGISSVFVTFDGYGDSGQIESIEARNRNDPIEIPYQSIEFQKALWDRSEIERTSLTVHDALESMCYGLLGQTHGGWENNDGAYGEFTFDVDTRAITLDYNERYTSSENYSHEF